MLTDNPAAPLILIVEDDDSHAECIRRSFEASPEEYRLHVTEVLHDAWKCIELDLPSLVLTDYLLPDGNGRDVVAMVNNTCPVIMMTSHGNEQVAVEAMRAGVQDYVVKSEDAFSSMPRVAGRALREWGLIQERKQAEEKLHRQEESLRALVGNAPDPIVRYDLEARRSYVNPAFEKLAGKPASQLLGKTSVDCFVGRDTVGGLTHQSVLCVLAEVVPVEVEVSWENERGVMCWYQINFVPEFDRDGIVMSVLSIARDISLIRSYQQQLHKLAYFDTLTALPNRVLFNDRLHHAIAESARHAQHLGLMLLDLDRFKTVNDSLGHGAGDRLLCEVGQRIRTSVRNYDTVARLGGDEFAIMLPEIRHGEDMGTIARKIIDSFAAPFAIDGQELFITASVGITFYPLDAEDPETLIQCSDIAMYHAKSRGRNNFQFYSADLTANVAERQMLENGLRQALKGEELEIYYQPKIELSSGTVVGAEALIRWNHPERGLVPPVAFIGIAEDTGMIVEIGAWVLRGACLTAKKWNSGTGRNLKIAVNMSPRQFAEKNLARTVHDILLETGCKPEWLEIEITESLLLNDGAETRSVLEAFHDMGISVAIDDFGTGYSALLYLTRFPIDTIKIDRSFIEDVTTNADSAQLVHAIVSLAGSLRMALVAEGVETAEQATYLDGIGCQMAQGYLFGRPVPIGQFETQVGI